MCADQSGWKSFLSRILVCLDIGEYWQWNSIAMNSNRRFCSAPKQGPIISESNSMLIWAYNEKVRIVLNDILKYICFRRTGSMPILRSWSFSIFVLVINSFCYWYKIKNTLWEWEWEFCNIVYTVLPETEPVIHSLSKVLPIFFTIFFNFLSDPRRFILSFWCGWWVGIDKSINSSTKLLFQSPHLQSL